MECQQQWLDASWGAGVADEKVLIGLRSAADTLERVLGATYASVCDLNEEIPVAE